MAFEFNITTATAGLGVVLNCLLIFLILKNRYQTNIGSFKWALILLASLEAIFALDLVLAPPYFIIYDGTWIALAFDTPLSDNILSYLTSVVYCSLHQIYVGIIAAIFLYRYIVICQEKWYEYLQGSTICMIFFGIIYIIHVITSLLCGIVMCEHNGMTELVRFHLINISGLAIPANLDYLALNPKYTIGWIGYWNHIFIYYGSVPIYIFCAVSIYIKIKKSSSVFANSGSMEVQRKMFYLVLIQTITPLLMSNTPFLAVLSFPLWDPAFVFTSTSTMMPLMATIPKMVDPIAIILFVPAYRNSIFKMFGCARKSLKVNTTLTSSSNPNASMTMDNNDHLI